MRIFLSIEQQQTEHLITTPLSPLESALNLRKTVQWLQFQDIFSMGHLASKVSERVEKEDINPNYQTYGREGDADYAVDRNGLYQAFF